MDLFRPKLTGWLELEPQGETVTAEPPQRGTTWECGEALLQTRNDGNQETQQEDMDSIQHGSMSWRYVLM